MRDNRVRPVAAGSSLIEKPDPAAAGMSAERLARIAPRMKDFVDGGKAAGIVTLVARRGHIASLDAMGYQDRGMPSIPKRLASATPRAGIRRTPFCMLPIRRREMSSIQVVTPSIAGITMAV